MSVTPPPPLPYAAATPQALPPDPLRCGDFLVLTGDTALPRFCVLCGLAADGPPVRLAVHTDAMSLPESLFTFRWSSPLPFILRAHFCPSCRRIYRLGRALPFGCLAVTVACACGAVALESGPLVFAAVLFFVLTIVADKTYPGPAYHHTRGGYHYVHGFSPAFLAHFPPSPALPDAGLAPAPSTTP